MCPTLQAGQVEEWYTLVYLLEKYLTLLRWQTRLFHNLDILLTIPRKSNPQPNVISKMISLVIIA